MLGGSGETGKMILHHLLANAAFAKIVLVLRRPIEGEEAQNAKVEQRVVDFENLEPTHFRGADVAFCALGTTRWKGGRQGIVKVDHDYVVAAAKMLKDVACKDFHLVSCRGAHPKSLYLSSQTKVVTVV